MNYPNQNDDPARQALTRAVDLAIANGSPVVVNVADPARCACGAKIPTIAVSNGQTRCYICTAKASHIR